MEIRLGNLTADPSDPIDISIPLDFNGPQPNAYGAAKAVSRPYESGDLIGDTRLGGSCNFEQYTLVPQCNGTHTECVGHITRDRISIRDCLKDAFIPAVLVSIEPTAAPMYGENYASSVDASDRLITSRSLTDALQAALGSQMDLKALLIRTLPNDDAKLTAEYGEMVPPYLSNDAVKFIVENGFDHLVLDVPSIDRLYDEGKLSNHRLFWNVEPGSFEITDQTRTSGTITEMAYIPNDVPDGVYLLNLQIAPFVADAAPSRPILFRAKAP
jgi:kynurenine formamidase